jgi:hypothetical protein
VKAGLALIAFAYACPAQNVTCTATDGRKIEPRFVRYSGNSDREIIDRIQRDERSGRCTAVWILRTEIRAAGTPYDFHLERISRSTRRLDARDIRLSDFVKRDKTYEFVFDADSTSIREMRQVTPSVSAPTSQSNRTLWDSILEEQSPSKNHRKRDSPQLDPTKEFNRTAWVVGRREIQAHFVGRARDRGQNEKIVALNKTRTIHPGQLGQIEAVKDGFALVRFYEGSRVERFGGKKNILRRWYASTGGPYTEVKDGFFSAERAEIVEVSIDDIIEVNDYLDQLQTDRT